MNYFNQTEQHTFICSCGDKHHQIVFSWFEEEVGPKELIVSPYLNNSLNFWQRLVEAFKFIFKLTPSRYGHWDSIVFQDKELDDLCKFLSQKQATKE